MNGQVLHLIFATGRPQITVRVVPMSVGAHAALRGDFMMTHYMDR
jgi:Domain of unknown function (DUF5753)